MSENFRANGIAWWKDIRDNTEPIVGREVSSRFAAPPVTPPHWRYKVHLEYI